MQLNGEQQKKAVDWLNSHWTNPKRCPMCNNNNWNISDRVYQLSDFNQGSVIIGGPVQPVLSVSCTNCSNTILLNAIQMGIISGESHG